MASKKTFINPLTRSSEEQGPLQHHAPDRPPSPVTSPLSPPPTPFPPGRKRGNQAFEKTHQRFTGWIEKNVKQQFDKLVEDQGVSKTSLFNEALADLLRKYMQK
jgi:hypothetical protein